MGVGLHTGLISPDRILRARDIRVEDLPPTRREDVCKREALSARHFSQGKRKEGEDERFDRLYQLRSTTFPACDCVGKRCWFWLLRENGNQKGGRRTSSFSIVASAIRRTSSCTSKLNMGPDMPRYLFTMKSSAKESRFVSIVQLKAKVDRTHKRCSAEGGVC